MRAELTSATASAAGGSWSLLGIVAAAAIGGLTGVVGVGLRATGEAPPPSAAPAQHATPVVQAPPAAAPAEGAPAPEPGPTATRAASAVPQPAAEELPPGLDQLLAPPAEPVHAPDDPPGYRPARPPRTRVGGKAPGPLGPWGAQR